MRNLLLPPEGTSDFFFKKHAAVTPSSSSWPSRSSSFLGVFTCRLLGVLLVAGDVRLPVSVGFPDLLAHCAQGFGLVLAHFLSLFLIFPKLVEIVLQVHQDVDLEVGNTFLVHDALGLPVGLSQELRLLQSFGDILSLSGIASGADELGRLLTNSSLVLQTAHLASSSSSLSNNGSAEKFVPQQRRSDSLSDPLVKNATWQRHGGAVVCTAEPEVLAHCKAETPRGGSPHHLYSVLIPA